MTDQEAEERKEENRIENNIKVGEISEEDPHRRKSDLVGDSVKCQYGEADSLLT